MPTVTLVVPSRADAKQILLQWEQEDMYYSGMKDSVAATLNMAARRYPYLESAENMATTTSLIIDKGYPLSTNEPVQVVYLDGQSDAGLPHTRGLRGIALPVFLLWNPSEKTVRHELVHLSQKQFPERWWAWYEREWNFRKCLAEEFMAIPEKWRSRRRINPDTLGSPYTIWKGRYIPLSVFSGNDASPDLKRCKRGFWDLVMGQWTWEPPSGWISMLGEGFNDEHPNEIAAHWIDGSAGAKKREYFNLMPI